RMAVAFYRAGDFEHGDEVGAPLAGRTLPKELAREFNGFVNRRDAAFQDYRAALEALAKGKDAEASPPLDRALAFFRTVRRPELPHTRGDAALELAAAILAPPIAEADAARAEQLASRAGDGQPARRAVVVAAALSRRGPSEEAEGQLRSVDEAALGPDWRLLVLETRWRLARTDAERRAVAAAAGAIQPEKLGTDARRERLKALGSPRR
ncbi:MAG TPA: hypothetical protein VIV59_14205, partial [Anaeromyxobacteraceae bacterium]